MIVRTILTISAIVLLLGIVFLPQPLAAQQNWYYQRAIEFPSSDTNKIKPYAMTVDSKGNIWVVSSIATDSAAHNSVWKTAPADSLFRKVVDFGSYYDTSSASYFDNKVGSLRGIAALGQNIYLTGNQPYPLTKPNTVSFMYILRGGSLNDSLHLGFGIRGGGFGTYIDAIEMTSDSIAFVATPYDPNKVGPSFRAYNLRSSPITAYDKKGTASVRQFGYFLLGDPSYAFSGYYSPAPGGPMDPNAYDQIRNIALIPGMNYGDSAKAIANSYFYTSRTSAPTKPTSGGIAVWKGGYNRQPSLYSAQLVTDVAGDLSFSTFTYYGIAADSSGNLYVCRADSLFKWVKIFQVTGTFATQIGQLPSMTDPNNPDPKGAPFEGPTDIIFSPDQQTAYVIDQLAKKVFVFTTTVTGINEPPGPLPGRFVLEQNYPNPFNPATTIAYELEKTGKVTLKVFNILGQEVAALVDGIQSAGKHVLLFDASKLTSGVYFYTLESGAHRLTRKMILMK